MRRRRLLGFGGALLPLLAGCSGIESRTGEDTPETRTGSPSPAPSPEAYLPEPTDGWRLERTEERTWSRLGGSDGVRAYFTGPDGVRYQVLVMCSETYAAGTARSWRCAGWQVAVAIDGVAIAASTGTEQRTFTPERPPTMTRSPVPGSEDRVRELLLLSPRLASSDVPSESTCEN